MADEPMPVVFISHGSPMLALRETPAHVFLKSLGLGGARPRALLVVSAHWETRQPMVSTADKPGMIYDFGGFDPRLRTIVYDAPGAPQVALRARELLEASGLETGADPRRGYDHGVWVPLHLMAPDRSVPVATVSIQPAAGPAHHLAVGKAIAPLRDEGVMIVASGALTHNLLEFRGQPTDAAVPGWVDAFREWTRSAVEAGDLEALADYRSRAPHATRNHPEDEHLLPLFVAAGAVAGRDRLERVHASVEHGVIAMDVYRSAA